MKPLKVMRLNEVMERTGLSRSSIYQKISEKNFPTQISLSANSVGWIESEVEAWIVDRISQSRGESAGHSTQSENSRSLEDNSEVLQ
jgi:prophage regulatory protein